MMSTTENSMNTKAGDRREREREGGRRRLRGAKTVPPLSIPSVDLGLFERYFLTADLMPSKEEEEEEGKGRCSSFFLLP